MPAPTTIAATPAQTGMFTVRWSFTCSSSGPIWVECVVFVQLKPP